MLHRLSTKVLFPHRHAREKPELGHTSLRPYVPQLLDGAHARDRREVPSEQRLTFLRGHRHGGPDDGGELVPVARGVAARVEVDAFACVVDVDADDVDEGGASDADACREMSSVGVSTATG